MTEERDRRQNEAAILSQLSAISISLAVNTAETTNIKAIIAEIKADVKDIKAGAVTRKELEDALTIVKNDIAQLKEDISQQKKVIYGALGTVFLAFLGAVLKLIIK